MPTIVAFVLVFGTIVFFHELGHFLVAKLSGIVVYEFSLGFGPRLLQTRYGETNYSLRLLPLGGFVKLAGMDEADNSLDTVAEDSPGSFNNKSLFVRMMTIAAGPLMNFILAAVILALYAMFVFIPPTIVSVIPDLPADESGLQVGDQIIEVNGEPVSSLEQITDTIKISGGKEIRFIIKREDNVSEVSLVPKIEDNNGVIGVILNAKPKIPFPFALKDGLVQTWIFTRETILALLGMFRGQVEAEIAGPIGIYQMVGSFAAQGISSLLILAAVLNVNLGLLNLLPIPVLDGGWLLIFLIEALRGKPLKEEHRGLAQFLGLALLLMLMVYATYSDLVNLFS